MIDATGIPAITPDFNQNSGEIRQTSTLDHGEIQNELAIEEAQNDSQDQFEDMSSISAEALAGSQHKIIKETENNETTPESLINPKVPGSLV